MGNFVNIQEEYDNMIRNEVRGEIINKLAENFKANEIADFLGLDEIEVLDIIKN